MMMLAKLVVFFDRIVDYWFIRLVWSHTACYA